MKRLFVSIFKTALAFYIFIPWAQAQVERDSIQEPSQEVPNMTIQKQDQKIDLDSISDNPKVPVIRRLEFSIDYLKLVSFALPSETKMEGGLAIITKPNIGISFEFGYGAKMPEEHFKNAEYQVDGLYGRAGLSYHYPFDPNTNFFLGAKYGVSNYQDEATYSIESSLWNPYEDSFQRTDLSAQWVEFIAGSESRFKGNFYLGFIFRFRALISHDDFTPLEVYAVPGYGRTMDKTLPALNLYIKYMLNFGKQVEEAK
jgi:hypothetical protein